MRSRLLLAALCASVAVTAHAAPGGDAPPPPGPGGPGGPDGPPPGGGLFISPDGEPFRQGDGRAAWFEGADANHDGALSLAEFRADAMRFFKVLDANGDGMIDGHENQLYETKIAPEITRMSFGAGPPRGGAGGPPRGDGKRPKSAPIGREGAARFSMLNEPQPVRGADVNLDYRITPEEWAKTAGKRFAILDKDDDGRLTLDTLPKAPGKRPEGGRRKPPS